MKGEHYEYCQKYFGRCECNSCRHDGGTIEDGTLCCAKHEHRCGKTDECIDYEKEESNEAETFL